MPGSRLRAGWRTLALAARHHLPVRMDVGDTAVHAVLPELPGGHGAADKQAG